MKARLRGAILFQLSLRVSTVHHCEGPWASSRVRKQHWDRGHPPLCFQHVNAAATSGYHAVTASRPVSIELLDSTRVDVRKHVNASVYAVARCIRLALLTLTAEEPQVPLQQPAGGDVSYPLPMRSMALFRWPYRCCRMEPLKQQAAPKDGLRNGSERAIQLVA